MEENEKLDLIIDALLRAQTNHVTLDFIAHLSSGMGNSDLAKLLGKLETLPKYMKSNVTAVFSQSTTNFSNGALDTPDS